MKTAGGSSESLLFLSFIYIQKLNVKFFNMHVCLQGSLVSVGVTLSGLRSCFMCVGGLQLKV